MKAKDDFLAGSSFKKRSGEQIRFWEDICLGDKRFKDVYPNFYRIVRKKDDTVANVLRTTSLSVLRHNMSSRKFSSLLSLPSSSQP